MRSLFLMLSLFCATTILTACNHAEMPSKTDRDVSAAREDARRDNFDTGRVANEERRAAGEDAAEVDAEADYEVAMERIAGEYKVANEKCDALGDDAQDACKEAAGLARDDAREQAKLERDANSM